MDTSVLKERAKNNIGKKRGETIVVALIIAFVTGTLSLPTGSSNFSFNYNINGEPSIPNPSDLDTIFSGFDSLFQGVFLLVIAVAAIIALAKTVFLSPLTVGGLRYFLKLRKDENTGIGEVIGNFKDGNYLNIVLIMFLQNLFTALWSLLCVIPGIIKGIEYSMIPFILSVRPDIDRKEAFRLSRALTHGHKLDLFLLDLSFIGWELLSVFTCGILSIVYVNPYIFATDAEAFAYLRENAIKRGAVSPEELPIYGGDSPDFTDDPFGGIGGFGAPQEGFNQAENSGFYSNQSSGFSSPEGTQDNPFVNNSPAQGSTAFYEGSEEAEPSSEVPTAEAEIIETESEKEVFDATTDGSANHDSYSQQPESTDD